MFKYFFALVFSVSLCCTAQAVTSSSAQQESLNSVVAIVNNDVITQSELAAAVAQTKQQLAASGHTGAFTDNQLRKMVLKELVDQKLQLELAKQAKLSVSNAQVNQAITHIAQGNHLSVNELKSKLREQGVKFSAYQRLIHDQLLVHQVQQSAVGAKVSITPEDIAAARATYASQQSTQQSFHVIDIVVSTKEKAADIVKQLKNGADIKTIAPEDTSDLGWRTTAMLPTLFLDQLQKMKTGDVAGPIQAPNGYHVIKLVGTQGASSDEPTKTQLQNIAYQMKFQQAVEKWMAEIRKTAYVKIVNP